MEFSKNIFGDFYSYTGIEDDHIQRRLREYGHLDEGISRWILKNVHPGWVVYDIGANVFEYSELAARQSGEDGVVYAFEPQQTLIEAYERCKELNNYDGVAKINVFPFGLSDSEGTVAFYRNMSNCGGSTIDVKFKKYAENGYRSSFVEETIEVKRMDTLELDGVIPDLLKVDIEGAEENFWRGAPEFIKKAKHIVAEMGPYTSEWLLSEYMTDRKAYDIHDELLANNVTELVRKLKPFFKLNHQKDIVFK